MPKTNYPGLMARLQLGGIYLLIALVVFGTHVVLSDDLFPDPQQPPATASNLQDQATCEALLEASTEGD